MSEETEGWRQGTWYTCRVRPGAMLLESSKQQTPFLSIGLEVTTGPLFGQVLEGQLYLTEKTKDRVGSALKLMGFDVFTDDWSKVGAMIEGKEVDVEPQLQEFRGEMRARANNYRRVRTGEEEPLTAIAARLFGNTVASTSGSDPDY